MKRNLLHTIWAAAMVLLAASCGQEELPEVEADGTRTLAITVTDGGYATGDRPAGAPQTRAVENDYATAFTAGDACGLYIVRGGEVVYGNVKLTATDGDGGLLWQPEAGVTLAGGLNGEAYYLYYPYQATMTGKTASAPSADMTDADFFAPLISGWQPLADQSDYAAGYSASDLMTATAGTTTKEGGTLKLSFAMTHRMALAVIDLPKTDYQFTPSDIPTYTAPSVADFSGSDARPCRMADNTYRYLVSPTATPQSPTITGRYSANGTREFSITPDGIAQSNYKTYKVDGGGTATVERQYPLQIGDFFCKDAQDNWYIIPSDAASALSEHQCIGIVFHAGRHDKDEQSVYTTPLATGGPTLGSAFHGYVVALTDVHNDSNDRLCWEKGPGDAYDQKVGASTATDDWNGYYNCCKVHDFVTNQSANGWEMKHFPAAHACETYGNRTLDPDGNPTTGQYDWQEPFAAPSNTSGWFLPSCGQLKYLYDNREFLSSQIRTVGNNTSSMEVKNYIKWFSTSWYYWSSSEYDYISDYAWCVRFSNGDVDYNFKDVTRVVRAVLAF